MTMNDIPLIDGDDLVDVLNRWATIGLVPSDIETLLSDAAAEILRLRDGWGVWHAEYMEADNEANLWKGIADSLYHLSKFLVVTMRNQQGIDNPIDNNPIITMMVNEALTTYEELNTP